MYLDMLVDIPDIKGKIIRMPKGDAVYINFEYGRDYDRVRKYAIPRRVIIGKQSRTDPTKMQPNQNYLTYILDVRKSEEEYVSGRSSCLKIGAFLVINRILEEYGIPELLGKHFNMKEVGLFEDLMAYCLICESNSAQYFTDYIFDHPLFAENMQPVSDTQVAEFLIRMTGDQSNGFRKDWNRWCDHREKIYVSLDAFNKNGRVDGIELVDPGELESDAADLTLQYAVGYDAKNARPLFYEAYPGRVVTVSQLNYILDKVKGYGYDDVDFILDRGYFSRDAIHRMDTVGCGFLILAKSTLALVDELILRNRGSFENDRSCSIPKYHLQGKTVKRKLFADDEKERYFHIYYSIRKEQVEREDTGGKLECWEKLFQETYGRTFESDGNLRNTREPVRDKDGIWAAIQEKRAAIRRKLQLCGYFVLISSENMTAAEALELYNGKDASEKLFCGDKYYLGNTSVREYFSECVSARTFVEFTALIIRNRIYSGLRDMEIEADGKPMDVTAALKELEKIEIVRGLDRIYRMEHTVTKTQETILKAFGIDAEYVKEESKRISEELRKGLPVIANRS